MQGQPIPFIDIQDIDKDGEVSTVFQVNPQAIKMLTEQRDKKVAVLVIAGPQRTGKSFLANRVLKRQNGFAIGPTTNPCTKGIWIWNQPLPLDPQTNLILLDTEGLHSVCNIFIPYKSQRTRYKYRYQDIFSVCPFKFIVRLQPVIIYQHFIRLGHIDEQSIENLSLVVNLSENISVGQGQDEKKLLNFFPQFLWVLRDFSLDLKGRQPREYLEYALSPASGSNGQTQQRNAIRSKIKEYFQQRDCLCLVRPLDNEQQLARIEDQDWNTLRPEFMQLKLKKNNFFFSFVSKGVQEFEKRVKMIQPKQINGTVLTSEMFVKLTLEYVDAINSGGVPQVLTSLDRVMQQEARQLVEELKNMYLQRFNELLAQKGKGPWDDEEFQTANKITSNYIIEKLEQRGKDLIDATKVIQMRKELTEMMEKDYQQKAEINKEQGSQICSQLITRFFNSFQLPMIENVEGVKESLLREKYQEFSRFYQFYTANGKGQNKYKLLVEKIPSFLFGFFEKILQSVQKVYNDEHNNTKKFLVQAREGEERLRKTMKDYEGLLYEVQKERENQKYEVEQLYRELQKDQNLRKLELDSLQVKLESLQNSYQSKKEKNAKYKNENQDLVEELQRVRGELNAKKVECAGLIKRIQEDGSRNDIVSIQGDKIEDMTNDLMIQYKDMRRQANLMNEFFKRRAFDGNQQQMIMQEVQKLQQEKYIEIQKIKEDFKQKKQKFRDDIEKEKKALKTSLDHIMKQNDELKAQNMTFIEKQESIQMKEQQIQSLLQENQKIQQALNQKQSNLETHFQVIENFTKDIMKLTGMKEDLEQKLAFLNSEKSNLVSFKESFPYILKESLRWVLNKNSKLKHAIRSLNEEDQIALKECFHEIGINI